MTAGALLRLRRSYSMANKETLPESRMPLIRRKQKLLAFLRRNGPSTRREMAAETGVPSGSLTALLVMEEFQQVSHGLWGLTE